MRFAILAQAVLLCEMAAAQNSGTIAGRVTAPDGSGIPDAPVQALHAGTSTPYRAIGDGNGAYSIGGLPAGEYMVTVVYPGFRFGRFSKEAVQVAAGATVPLEIVLPDNNQGTLGDDPFTYNRAIRERVAQLAGPVPRTADGRPDLSGAWYGNDDLFPEEAEVKAWVKAKAEALIENHFKDEPGVNCLPATLLITGPFIRKFVQTPALLVILTEDDVVGYRQVYLDGRAHPKDDFPQWLGHSTGRWDGDTLVVDRANFNDRGLVGIYSHTEDLHVVERYRRVDYGHMEVDVTVEDPGAFEKPWHVHMVWNFLPDQDIYEYVCAENNVDLKHMVGK